MNNTRYMTPQDGIEREIHTWKADGKWYSCYSGTYRGIYSESDNFGPFETEGEASEFAGDAITTHITG
jgi:hypothetical protein